MKIGFNPQSIVGLDGMPLVGRVTFYVHDSDVKATVYSMQGDAFVESQNPQLLNNAGRLNDTVFFDAAIIDVSIQQYIGESGHMTPDSPDEDFEQFDHFEIGFELPTAESVPNVGTIEELEDSDTSVGVVLVTGYYTKGDCAARFYLWDKDSNNTPDGGYVIASNNSDSGRWILLWDDDTIPSSFYGIVPGSKEANISVFLSYPQQVGSHLLPTSPVPRFERGTYASSVVLTTSKHVKFDSGSKFIAGSFTLPSATVEPSNSYVADFYFNGRQPKAESGWFRTLKAFWRCNASELVISHDNFEDKEIDTIVSVQGRVISGAGRIPATYSNGGYLYLYNCAINASKFLSPRYDRVRFGYAHWSDNWWVELTSVYFDFGSNPGVQRIVFRSSDNNTFGVEDFFQTDTYVKAAIANGNTYLDLQGHSVGTITLDQVVSLSNANADRIILAAATVNLDNVKCNDVRATYADGYTQLSVDNSSVKITTATPKLSALLCTNSKMVIDGTIDPLSTVLVVQGGTWAGNVMMTDAELDAFQYHDAVQIYGTKFTAYSVFKVSNLRLENSEVYAQINLYPYKKTDGNSVLHHYYNMSLVNNRFIGSYSGAIKPRVHLTYYHNAASQHEEISTSPLEFAFMRVVNNRFDSTDEYGAYGIYMVKWTYYGMNKAVADNVGFWEYHGNVGNCPKLCPPQQNGSLYGTTSGKWNKCSSTYNLWIPYANYADGSVITAKDGSGLQPWAALIVNKYSFPSGNIPLIAGFYSDVISSIDLNNTLLNNMFIAHPAITNGTVAPTIDENDVIEWPTFVNAK